MCTLYLSYTCSVQEEVLQNLDVSPLAFQQVRLPLFYNPTSPTSPTSPHFPPLFYNFTSTFQPLISLFSTEHGQASRVSGGPSAVWEATGETCCMYTLLCVSYAMFMLYYVYAIYTHVYTLML